ncbi:MAG TPA: hypothetical protein ENI35_04120 [Candidatus Desulfofervidus auxilii]|uniref:Class II aldolase/adducin N-terminal domain-containing protein n=1 Tax=Desulfofervidus auxilii TaxID=1621989 RepID=A0A7C1VNR5_DESA2|nr:hypothetical protein [Candidatus Desulfofervidus auxilii]
MSYEQEKGEIIFWGAQLYQKGLLCGTSGNISQKIKDKILITAHNAYLGFLEKEDILVIDKEGNVLEGSKKPTSELALHLVIHKTFKEKPIVIHAHSPWTVYYFHYFDTLTPITFEEKIYLGNIIAIPQTTPTVTDVSPVISALENNDIVVLKNHGVVAVGKEFVSVFSLIELLETTAKVSLITHNLKSLAKIPPKKETQVKKYKLFSKEHIKALVETINNDQTARSLGEKFNLTTVLCNKETDSKTTISFCYQQGKIIQVKNSEENAEFVFSAKGEFWKKIFNGELDPFVAFNQGKIKLKGDFNKLSKWFPVFERTFALWKKVGVE